MGVVGAVIEHSREEDIASTFAPFIYRENSHWPFCYSSALRRNFQIWRFPSQSQPCSLEFLYGLLDNCWIMESLAPRAFECLSEAAGNGQECQERKSKLQKDVREKECDFVDFESNMFEDSAGSTMFSSSSLQILQILQILQLEVLILRSHEIMRPWSARCFHIDHIVSMTRRNSRLPKRNWTLQRGSPGEGFPWDDINYFTAVGAPWSSHELLH